MHAPRRALRLRRLRRLLIVALPLIALSLIAMTPLGCCVIIGELGGAFSYAPADMQAGMSEGGRALVARALAGLPAEKILDYHTHIAGIGSNGTGVFISDEMTSWLHPMKRIRYFVFMSATGVEDRENADQEYVRRLLDLAHHAIPGARYAILAFDKNYLPDGSANLEATELYVPNEYVFKLAEEHPDVFVPVMSIHPYRKDALAELDKWAARGGKMLKWLPNAMGIDPANPLCDAFYDRLRELGIVLLTHAGEEQAVDSSDAQALGNPLRLRRALDHGVKVIVAHCATAGSDLDLDSPKENRVSNLSLFLRLMDEKKYEGLLFGDISATMIVNRPTDVLVTLLARTDLHARLVNGSDYPIPAINCLVRLGRLESAGLITGDEADQLQEIYEYNPLLFDFVLKRTLRHPETGARFADSVFLEHPALRL